MSHLGPGGLAELGAGGPARPPGVELAVAPHLLLRLAAQLLAPPVYSDQCNYPDYHDHLTLSQVDIYMQLTDTTLHGLTHLNSWNTQEF